MAFVKEIKVNAKTKLFHHSHFGKHEIFQARKFRIVKIPIIMILWKIYFHFSVQDLNRSI